MLRIVRQNGDLTCRAEAKIFYGSTPGDLDRKVRAVHSHARQVLDAILFEHERERAAIRGPSDLGQVAIECRRENFGLPAG